GARGPADDRAAPAGRSRRPVRLQRPDQAGAGLAAAVRRHRHHRRHGVAVARGAADRLSLAGGGRLMSRLRGRLDHPLLSVVMPAYNGEATIEEIIRRVLAVPIRTELIVVDDGSTDRTREILTRLAAELPVKVIFQPANAGKGAALRRGFQEVTGDLVV